MRKAKFWTLLLAVALVGAMVLSACGGGASSSAPAAGSGEASSAPADSTPAAGGDATMRVSWWGGQGRADITQEVIDMFKAENPGLTVNPEFTSFDGYWEKMSAMSAASNLPDVFQHDLRYIKTYAAKGLLLDMTPYKDNGFDTTDIGDVMIDAGTFDGKLYGVPLGTNILCVMYDPALFAEAGIDEPTNDWTWDDYREICLAFKEKLDIYGDGEFAGIGYNGWNFALQQYGQALYTDDGSALGFTDDSILTKLLALDNELYTAGAVVPPSVRIEIQESESEFIVTERAAMASVQWSNGFTTMVEAAGRELKMVLPPNAADQSQYGNYIKPAQYFTVAANSPVADMAVSFIDYFTNSVEANLVLAGERGVPINAKVRDALAEQLSDDDRYVFEFLAAAEAYAGELPPSTPSFHAEVENLISNIDFMVEDGSLTPEDAPAYFREEVEQLYANQK